MQGDAVLNLLPPNWKGEVRFESHHMGIIRDFVKNSRKLSEGLMQWVKLKNGGKQVLWEKLNEYCRAIASVFRPFWRDREMHISLRISSASDLWLDSLTVEVEGLWELTKKVWTMIQHEYDAAPFATRVNPRTPRSLWIETRALSFGSLSFGKRSDVYAPSGNILSSLDTRSSTPTSPITPSREPSATDMSPRRFFGSPTAVRTPLKDSFVSAAEKFRNRVLSFGSRSGVEAKEIDDFGLVGAAFEFDDHTKGHKPTDSGVGSSDGFYSPAMDSQQCLMACTSTEPIPSPSLNRSFGSLNVSREDLRTFETQHRCILTSRQSSSNIRSLPGSPTHPVAYHAPSLPSDSERTSFAGSTRSSANLPGGMSRKGSSYSLFPASPANGRVRLERIFTSPLSSQRSSGSSGLEMMRTSRKAG